MARVEPAKPTPGGAPPAKRLLSDEQRRDWLRLIRSENIGPTTFRELVNHFGGAGAALDALPELSRKGGRNRPLQVCSRAVAEAEIEEAERCGAQLVAIGETGYPAWLARTDAPPPLLYVKGISALADEPILAIVGARNGSAIGCKFTRLLADDLGKEGFVIASGIARGIDTAAHVAALERGTIAVLAGGIDVVYPPENAKLHAAIGERGLLVTERPPGLQPRGQDFPRRNRLISGISVGVVVVEAARRSGSLITARFAGEQGREVFAVPGHPLDPRAEGTNKLIKEGASLIESAADVVAVVAPILGRERPPPEGELGDLEAEPAPPHEIGDDDRARVLAALSFSPTDVDEIVRTTGLPSRAVQVVLLELDLAGRLERCGQQRVALRDLTV